MSDTPPDYPTLQSIGWPWPGPPQEPAWQAVFAAHPQALPARGVEQPRTGLVGADTPGARLQAQAVPGGEGPPVPRREAAVGGGWGV
ncbi:GTPase RsgA, partial [Xanthomonas perforans]